MDLKNAEEIKALMLKQLQIDSTATGKSRFACFDSIQLLTEEDCIKLYKNVNKITYDMHSDGNDAGATVILYKILDILENADLRSHPDNRELLNIYVRLGATFSDLGMPGMALDYYLTGLNKCTDTIYNDYKAMLYNNIGILYAEGDMTAKAEDYFRRALQINIDKKHHKETYLNYSNLAELYARQGQTEKALEASQRSLDYIDNNKQPAQLASLRLQQGALYARLKQNDVAMLRFNSGLQQYKELGDASGTVNAYLYISKHYLECGMPDSALTYAREALDICRQRNRDNDMVATFKILSRIYEAQGRFSEEAAKLREAMELGDSLLGKERHLRLNQRDETGQALASIHIQKKRRFPYLNLAVGMLLGIAMMDVCLFYTRYKKRNRTQTPPPDGGTSEALDKLNRELTTNSLEKLKLQEGLSEVCGMLRQLLLELNPKDKTTRDNIRSMLGRLNSITPTSYDDEFKLFFERVHPNFYKTLGERYPDLTSRDMRLCAFIYLGMTTKEIAVLTYREVRSVESSRNRLRKKLGLDINHDLSSYLRTLNCAGDE